MSNDIDFEQFIKLLDGALASDDKNVKQALRKFLFVAAMVMGDDCEPGPFTKMMETMDAMQRRLATLENQTVPTTQDWYGGSSPTFYPFIAPTTTGGSITGGSSGPTWTNAGTTTTNAISTTTVGGSTTTTGNITLSGGTSGYSYTPSPPFGAGTTSTITFTDFDNPETGTEIKKDIMEALDRLANAA